MNDSGPRDFPASRKAPRGPAARARSQASRRLETLLRGGGAFSPPPELILKAASRPPAPPSFLRRAGRFLGLLLLIGQLCFIGATGLLILAYRLGDPPLTVLMAYRAWGNGWKVQAPRPLELKRIPVWLRSMLIAVEDGKFYEHHGLDFEAIRRAREINARLGRPLYGGSTLSMQVARTLFLVPEKSYIRKYLEVIVALELELLLPKDRILELYFGYAEWGKGLFGIEAASRHWYGKGASALSRAEGARLIALLSSPIRYSPATIAKSGILRERLAYLERRFLGKAAMAAPEPLAAGGPPAESSAPEELGELSLLPAEGGTGSAEAPPPSLESAPPGEAATSGEAPAEPGLVDAAPVSPSPAGS